MHSSENISFKDFDARIHSVLADVPKGKVTTYGQLAMLAGFPRLSRRVARALRKSPPDLACYRVVNSVGRTVPGWSAQRVMLQEEGITFRENGCVDMRLHRWNPFTT